MQYLLEGGDYLTPDAYHRKYGNDNYTFEKFLTYGFTINLHSDLIIKKCKDTKFHLVREADSEPFFS